MSSTTNNKTAQYERDVAYCRQMAADGDGRFLSAKTIGEYINTTGLNSREMAWFSRLEAAMALLLIKEHTTNHDNHQPPEGHTMTTTNSLKAQLSALDEAIDMFLDGHDRVHLAEALIATRTIVADMLDDPKTSTRGAA